jgi:NADPH2:quinone reductase
VIYDPVGGDVFTAATHCIRPGGRILAIGYASGRWGEVDTAHLVYNNYSVVGVVPTHYDHTFKEHAQARLLGWRREGRLRLLLDGVVPFTALPEALERVLDGAVEGKQVLEVDPAATRP